jgi:hypothetical protein
MDDSSDERKGEEEERTSSNDLPSIADSMSSSTQRSSFSLIAACQR